MVNSTGHSHEGLESVALSVSVEQGAMKYALRKVENESFYFKSSQSLHCGEEGRADSPTKTSTVRRNEQRIWFNGLVYAYTDRNLCIPFSFYVFRTFTSLNI